MALCNNLHLSMSRGVIFSHSIAMSIDTMLLNHEGLPASWHVGQNLKSASAVRGTC